MQEPFGENGGADAEAGGETGPQQRGVWPLDLGLALSADDFVDHGRTQLHALFHLFGL
ncbi:MAG: hypothetical protein H0W33_12740 [Gammaproteobacteria bacterium]|nr:hypothetical protein [Gammaproteobacteria bacterium]